MKKYFKFLLNTILNYRLYSIVIIVYEIYFILKFSSKLNKLKYLNNDYLSDSIPCSFYILCKISNFVKKNRIKFICDLGSGYGKILYYFGNIKKIYIDGIEYESSIYNESKKLENEKIKVYNNDFFKFNFKEKNYNLLILNDPLKKPDDLEKLINLLKLTNKNHFLIFVNLSHNKIKIIEKNFLILSKKEFSNSRNYFFVENKKD